MKTSTQNLTLKRMKRIAAIALTLLPCLCQGQTLDSLTAKYCLDVDMTFMPYYCYYGDDLEIIAMGAMPDPAHSILPVHRFSDQKDVFRQKFYYTSEITGISIHASYSASCATCNNDISIQPFISVNYQSPDNTYIPVDSYLNRCIINTGNNSGMILHRANINRFQFYPSIVLESDQAEEAGASEGSGITYDDVIKIKFAGNYGIADYYNAGDYISFDAEIDKNPGQYGNWNMYRYHHDLEDDFDEEIPIPVNKLIPDRADFDANIGKYLYIRSRLYGGHSMGSHNSLAFLLRPSPAKINLIHQNNPGCYGETASITLQLEQALSPGEQLQFFWGRNTNLGSFQASDFSSDNTMTISGLAPKKDTLFVAGFDGVHEITATTQKILIHLEQPEPISFSAQASPALCYNLPTGSFTATASGGTGDYTLHYQAKGASAFFSIPFNNNRATVDNLLAKNYEYYVSDANECFSKDARGEKIIQEINISQPNSGISLSISHFSEPTAFDLANGRISVQAKGGSPYESSGYAVVWKKDGQLFTGGTVNNDYSNSIFTSTLSNIGAGIYLAEIRDKNDCSALIEQTLDQPEQLIASITRRSNISCKGESDGQLEVSITGGIAPYSKQWYKKTGSAFSVLTGETGSILSNVPAGEYQVKVEDAHSISITVAYTLSEPSLFTLEPVSTFAVSCFGGSNGSVRIKTAGGTPPCILHYKFETDDDYVNIPANEGNNGFYIQGLSAGTYRFYLTDTHQCTTGQTVESFRIEQPDVDLNIHSEIIQSPTGYGRSDGMLTAIIQGGSPFSNLPYYTVSWKNDKNLSMAAAYELNEQGVFVSKVENLPEGSYTVEIKDRNNCYLTAVYSLKAPDPLIVNLENTELNLCHGDSAATLIAHVSGGVRKDTSLPYDYRWFMIQEGNEIEWTNPNDSIAGRLPAGNYKVKIKDGSALVNQTESEIFRIAEPPLLRANITRRNISCYDLNDGFIRIQISGGTGDYRMFCKKNDEIQYTEYAVNATNPTAVLDNLFAGVYQYYVTDENQCRLIMDGKNIHEINLTQPTAPLSIFSDTLTPVSGFGRSDGSIVLTIEGGAPQNDNTYQVEWRNEGGQMFQASGSFSSGKYVSTLDGLPAGKYLLTVKDKNYATAYPDANASCMLTASYEMPELEKLTANIEKTHRISCYGRSDGQLVAHVAGGVKNTQTAKPYDYFWYKETTDGWALMEQQTDSLFSNASAGNYRVKIEDYSRTTNEITADYYLSQPDSLIAYATDAWVVCGQLTDVSATATGGTPPYRYGWNTGNTGAELANVGAGKYLVFVQDECECEATALSRISTPSDLEAIGIRQDPICFGASNGSIQLQVSGGTVPYSYRWNTGAVSKDLNNIPAGNYSVTVEDADHCSFFIDFVLSDPSPLMLDLGSDRILCKGQSLTITPQTNDPAVAFSWSGPDGFYSTDSTITVDKEAYYRLTVTDEKGCKASDEIYITAKDTDIASEIVSTSQAIVNDTVIFVNITNPAPERWQWLFMESDALTVLETTEYYARAVFSATGRYTVGFRTYRDECFADNIKQIDIIDADSWEKQETFESVIQQFTIVPNPNKGQFEANIELNQVSPIRLRIIQLGTGIVVSDRKESGNQLYQIAYQMPLQAGVYVVLLETISGNINIKMIIY